MDERVGFRSGEVGGGVGYERVGGVGYGEGEGVNSCVLGLWGLCRETRGYEEGGQGQETVWYEWSLPRLA